MTEDDKYTYSEEFPWFGGTCPVDGETLVRVKFKDPTRYPESDVAGRWRWFYFDNEGDIISYQVMTPKEDTSKTSSEAITASLEEKEYQSSQEVENVLEWNIEAYITYSIKAKGEVIFSGSKDELLRLKQVIEEALK